MNTLAGINTILSATALLGSLYCVWQIRQFNALKKTFFAGKNGADLEAAIFQLQKGLADSQKQEEVLQKAIADINFKTGFHIQKLGLVRFNPFDDGGGNFSFVLALLDLHDTGVIITSMHGRQQNRIYTKTVQNGHSEIALTEEEQQAITLAHKPRSN